MNSVFFELTVVLIFASVLSILFRFIKQPPILAYILAGIIIGPLGIIHLENKELLHSMAEIGVALLLFILGLELRFSDLKSVGKVALITGAGQITFTTIVGFGIISLLGFSPVAALYMAIALTFSSTIIIVKLLSDKRDLNSLYGKLAVGMLLVQDFCAVIALIILSSFSRAGGSVSPIEIGLVLIKGLILFAVTIYLSKTVFPEIIRRLARAPELLFLFSIAWAFGMAAFVSSPLVGFSIEIGGFLAGLALANSAESFHISGRTRSLRDFFITMFFVTLGMGMIFSGVERILFPALLLSAYILIGNPIIVMVILGLLGYRKRTSFLTGLTVAQISEFSLIIIFLGNKLGHLSQDVISLMTLVGVITFGASTYMIMNGNYIYKKLSKYLSVFERKNAHEKRIDVGEIYDHIVLAGVNRAGEGILKVIKSDPDTKYIVVDFNPDAIKKLEEEDIKAVFGDIADEEILEHIQITKAKIIVSTVTDVEDNLHLIKGIKKTGSKVKIICLARDKSDAQHLYQAGADYVVIPHITSGKHIARIIKQDKLDEIDDYREKDLKTVFNA